MDFVGEMEVEVLERFSRDKVKSGELERHWVCPLIRAVLIAIGSSL